jgi:hypothetical protein
MALAYRSARSALRANALEPFPADGFNLAPSFSAECANASVPNLLDGFNDFVPDRLLYRSGAIAGRKLRFDIQNARSFSNDSCFGWHLPSNQSESRVAFTPIRLASCVGEVREACFRDATRFSSVLSFGDFLLFLVSLIETRASIS